MKEITISTKEARANFAEIIERVRYSNDEYHITKHGKPIVKIISIKGESISKNFESLNRRKKLQKFLTSIDSSEADSLVKNVKKNKVKKKTKYEGLFD